VSKDRDPTVKAPEASSHDRSVRLFGFAIVFVLLGGFGVWATFAMIDSAAVAHGVVTVESYRQTVQHLEGGIVKELYVEEGDMVKAGDPLARLDDTQFSSQLESARVELGGLRALEARLRAERDKESEVAFPASLLSQAKDDSRLQEFIATQNAVFEARRADLEGRIAVFDQRIAERNEQIKGFEEREAKFQHRIDLYQDELKGLQSLFEDGMGDKVRMRALERELAEVEGDLVAVRTQRTSAQQQIDETKLQIDQARREFQRDVVTELSQVQERLFNAEERERGLADRVERTKITAPVSGRVVGLEVHTVGAVLSPGARLLDIVPDQETLVVDAQVTPQSVDKVFPGLNAIIRFTALNSRSTPRVNGRVKTVSADRLVDQQRGYPYYLARIEIPEDQMARLKGQTVLPGMPAEVMIVTGERTMLDYLIRPLKDAFARSMREK